MLLTLGSKLRFGNVATADVTAPVLSSASATATGSTTANASVSTNEAGGTMYVVFTGSATKPSPSQMITGQTSSGATAHFSTSYAVSGSGTQPTTNATGLSASTSYYAQFYHVDAAGNGSTVATSNQITTTASGVTAPTLVTPSMGSNTASVAFSGGSGYTTLTPQYSTDNSSWTSISNDTTTPFNFSGLSSLTLYYFRALPDNNVAYASNVVTGTTTAGGSTGISGGVLTLAGSGFGNIADPRPLVYDDFSSGTNAAAIPGQAPTIRRNGSFTWGSDGYAPTYSNIRVRPNETLSSRHRMTSSTSILSTLRYQNSTAWQNTGDVMFFSFWQNMHNAGSNYSDNFKPFYLYGTAGTEPSMPWGSGGPSDSSYRWAAQDGSNGGSNYQSGLGYLAFFENWGRTDARIVQSDATNQNGVVDISAHLPDGGSPVQRWNNTAVRTRGSLARYFDEISLGEFSNTGSGVDHIVYMSGIYISDTCVRVELANNSTWTSRTFSEIQPATSWADTQIQCVFKQGRFSSGATAYIFTVDANNVATYTGQTVIIP